MDGSLRYAELREAAQDYGCHVILGGVLILGEARSRRLVSSAMIMSLLKAIIICYTNFSFPLLKFSASRILLQRTGLIRSCIGS